MSNMVLYRYLQIKNWLEREEAQDLVEYALLLGLIALAAVVAVTDAGKEVNRIWGLIVTELKKVV